MERKVVLTSRHYSIFTPVAEAIRGLMYPFPWPAHYAFVPVLPLEMKDLLHAPTPFLYGLHRSFLTEVRLEEDIVTVDLDRDVIVVEEQGQGRDIRTIKTPYEGRLPDSMKKKLSADLRPHTHVYVGGKLDEVNNLDVIEKGMGMADDEPREVKAFDKDGVRIAFLQFWVDIIADYRKFLEYKDIKGLGLRFKIKEFSDLLTPFSVRKWFDGFAKTHYWNAFLEER